MIDDSNLQVCDICGRPIEVYELSSVSIMYDVCYDCSDELPEIEEGICSQCRKKGEIIKFQNICIDCYISEDI